MPRFLRAWRAVQCCLVAALVLAILVPVPVFADDSVPCGYVRVTGVVSAADTGHPLADVLIAVSGKDTFDGVFADTDGRYSVDLPAFKDPGPYFFSVSPSVGNGEAKYYLGEEFLETTDVISGSIKTTDIALAHGGVIQGTVKAADTDLGLKDVRVYATRSSGSVASATYSDDQGHFEVAGLETGQYFVTFDPRKANTDLLTNYVITNLGDTTVISESTSVAVTVGLTTTIDDMALKRGVELTGKVTRSDNGDPVPNVQVHAIATTFNLDGRYTSVWSNTTNSAGIYHILTLAPGEYVIGAVPSRHAVGAVGPNTDLLTQWYDNKAFLANADRVTIPEGGGTQTVDLTLTPGGIITGTLMDGETHLPLDHIGMIPDPIENDSNDVLNRNYGTGGLAETDAAGRYMLGGLYDGVYRSSHSITARRYVARGYPQPALTAIVTVTGGATVPNIDLFPRKGGYISGTLTNMDGAPLVNVEARIEPADGQDAGFLSATARTGADGRYILPALTPGDYRLHFQEWEACGCYNDSYYKAKPAAADPTLVAVVGGEATIINAPLACNAPPLVHNDIYLPLLSD